jgi:hypothetical protein
MKRSAGWVLGVCMAIAASAGDARAQMTMGTFKGYFTAHIGAVAGGDVTSARTAAGASVAVHEATGWGAEADFGRATGVATEGQRLDLTTYFVNAVWIRPAVMIRPFASAGAGLLQVDGCVLPCAVSPRTYDLAISAGGGAIVAVNDLFGVRGDVRYFFSAADHPELRRPDNIGFWRVSVGATFMWSIVP